MTYLHLQLALVLRKLPHSWQAACIVDTDTQISCESATVSNRVLCSVWTFNEIEELLLFLHLKALDFFFPPKFFEKRGRRAERGVTAVRLLDKPRRIVLKC